MLYGFWTWIPVVIVLFLIFYANKLPDMKKQAEAKLKEGKVLLNKKKKELEAKTNDVVGKVKEKQKKNLEAKKEKEAKEKALELDGEEVEITEEDLAFMPTDKNKDKK